MHKVLLTFFIAVLLVLFGCFKLNEGGESECFPYLRINFMSTSDIDSVQFYLNGEQVCIEKPIKVDGICENCTKDVGGVMEENVLCKVSDDDIYVAFHRGAKKLDDCIQSEGFPKWIWNECFLSEKQYGKPLDSLTLLLRIFSNKENVNVRLDGFLYGGKQYKIMAEQDTVLWYSYSNATMRANFNYYGSWERDGCYGGYCIASKHLAEICYDK
ncbi:hypothetical protein [uncultured Fibrobacter sp.]|uniref:hypothetical protein n=1 Tax=uncultured Fibrobacter sp. TaxID=261512 RepID=UPI0025EBF95D|nr:hypothetical protein [uncultured Fibrobacter sp.]